MPESSHRHNPCMPCCRWAWVVMLALVTGGLTAVEVTFEVEAVTMTTGAMTNGTVSLEQNVVGIHHGRTKAGGTDLVAGVLAGRRVGNNAPVVSDAATATLVDTPTTVTISASDADGDPLVYAIGTPTSGAVSTVVPATGQFTFTPATGFTGVVTIPVSVGDGWDVGNGTITVTVTTPVITVAPAGPLLVRETGTQASVTVSLGAEPQGTVTMAVASTDTSEMTVSASSLTFTPSDWSPQTILVTGADDALVDGDVLTTLQIQTASGGGYDGVDPADVDVLVLDDDAASLVVLESGGGTQVDEGGAADTFTVALGSPPQGTVTVTMQVGSQLVASPATVQFDTGTWATPRTISVTAVDDILANGDRNAALQVVAVGGGYDSVPPETIAVSIVDDDAAGLVVTPSAITVDEGGGTAVVQVSLSAQPAADITVSASIDDATEATVSPATRVIPVADWATPVTFTVTGADDSDLDGNTNFALSLQPSGEPSYNSQAPSQVVGLNLDDEGKTLLISQAGQLNLTEGDTATASYQLVLSQAPGADVTVTLAADGQVTPALSTAIFTTANWSTPQTVTVSVVDDAIAEGAHEGVISHTWTSADADYVSTVSVVVTALITDDDSFGIVVSPTTGLTTTETGGTDSFTVALGSEPTDVVDILVTSSDFGQGVTSASTLRFTPTDWMTAQTVTVTGTDANNTDDGDVPYTISVGPAISTDPVYVGQSGEDVLVTNLAVDQPPTIDALVDVTVVEDVGSVDVVMSGISAGQAGESQVVVVSAVSSNTALTGMPAVTYSDPATSGLLRLTVPDDQSGSATITVTVSDGVQQTDRAFLLTVTPVNDPPVIERITQVVVPINGSVQFGGLADDAAVGGQWAVSDIETTQDDLLVRIQVAPGLGVLRLADPVSGALTTIGAGDAVTAAAIDAGLLRYTQTVTSPATVDAVQFLVDDGDGGTVAGSMPIRIDPSVPAIDLLPVTTVTWTEGAGAVLLGDSSLVLDGDTTDFATGQVAFTITDADGDDVLAIAAEGDAPGQIGLSGTSVRFGGSAFGSWSGGTAGAPLVISFSAGASISAVQALVRRISYDHGSRNPAAGPREISAVLTDDLGNISTPALRSLAIVLVDDPPTVADLSVLTVAGVTVSGQLVSDDPEDQPLTYVLASSPAKGVLTDFDTATGAFTYVPGADQSGLDAFTLVVDDGTQTSAAATVSVQITGVDTTVRPWFVDRPPVVVDAGDLVQWTARLDTSALTAPALTFTLLEAPTGLTMVPDAAAGTAGLSWLVPTDATGVATIRILVTDSVSGSAAVQTITPVIMPLPVGSL